MNLRIRKMEKEDYTEICEIFEQGMKTNLATFQTQNSSYDEWDQSHMKECRFVTFDGDRVVGFAALSPTSSRYCFRGVAELSVYVHEEYKGRHIATNLVEHMIAQSAKASIWMLYSSVMENNTASIALHKKCGFREIGCREKIAQDQYGVWRNTVLFERRIESSEHNQ